MWRLVALVEKKHTYNVCVGDYFGLKWWWWWYFATTTTTTNWNWKLFVNKSFFVFVFAFSSLKIQKSIIRQPRKKNEIPHILRWTVGLEIEFGKIFFFSLINKWCIMGTEKKEWDKKKIWTKKHKQPKR